MTANINNRIKLINRVSIIADGRNLVAQNTNTHINGKNDRATKHCKRKDSVIIRQCRSIWP